MRRSVLALGAVLALVACGEEPESSPDRVGPDFQAMDADQILVEVEHYMTREGVRQAHLVADTVYLLEEGSSAHLRHYTVDFYDPQGDRTSVLTAEDGVYDMETGDMRATSDVVVVDPGESQRLTTERLRYDAKSGRLESDVDFTLVRGQDTVQGTGFVTDPGLDSLTTRQPAMVSPPEDGPDVSPEPADTGRDTAPSTGPADSTPPPAAPGDSGEAGG